ncbi:putative ankyrin repeat-containing domain-containing protein [Helianthus annuus]|uniref:Ankyrin repeat-containing domain-containing protein n=1 Tax=Helianthus annuus TaxID=4232 RepID=A0A251ST90_HELAN|nr:putative ankyrin repeat-containing domain-containing protein [Helianthus annuus]KAJ0848311.1 putative ankyrin repeat-containing domain-containing protein [Helianthus annuus]
MQFKMKRGNRNKKNQKRKGAEPGCCPSCQAITDVYRHLQTSHCQSAVHEAIWGSPQYPCPSHVNTSSFLSIKLDSHLDYVAWKEQMLCLLDSQGMRGFIDGTFKKPQANGGPKGKPEKTKYKEWSRSDALVKGWIFGSISEYNMDDVIGLETAHEVWNKLKNIFTTPPAPISSTDAEIQTQTDKEKCEEEYVPLCRAIGMGDWKKAQEFFNEDKDALINKLNHFGQRTLHLAIGNPENVKFLDNLLDLINPESLPTLVDNDGHNPLHLAATLDHREAAEKLVGKNPHLLFILDKHNCLPIQKAIYNSHKATFLYLLQVCKQYIGLSQQEGYHSPFMGQYGLMLLNETIWSGFFDVAYALLTEYPELATTIAPPYNSLLWSIGKEKDAFRSAKCYNFYQRFLYSRMFFPYSKFFKFSFFSFCICVMSLFNLGRLSLRQS